MMRPRFFMLSAVALILSGSAARALDPQIGRCLDGLCAWNKIIQKDLIKERGGAKLFRVTYQIGMAPHMDKSGHCRKKLSYSEADGLSADIQWYSASVAHVFCSASLPVVMTSIAKVVPLKSDQVTYGREDVIPLYSPVCHNISTQQFLDPEFQARNHYQTPAASIFMIKDPKELFDLQAPNAFNKLEFKL